MRKPAIKLTPHQDKLLALIKRHAPVTVQSQPKPVGPRLMLDGTIWANMLATDALIAKGLIERQENGTVVPL